MVARDRGREGKNHLQKSRRKIGGGGWGVVDENVLYHHFDGVTRLDMFVNSLSYTPEKDELYVNCTSINPT